MLTWELVIPAMAGGEEMKKLNLAAFKTFNFYTWCGLEGFK